jgi:type IV secretion system protein VirD4
MSSRSATGILFGQIVVVLGVTLGGLWIGTQWTAHALGYQARLGRPWFAVSGLPVYEPWRLFEWWYFYGAYSPRVFERGGIIAASSGMLSTGAAICMAIWRSRLAKQVTTYGSARWAKREEVTKAGLTRPAGVFLGMTEHTDAEYLRHEGPEHVMAFAPTRSGKGVGLVVPSLLCWPARQ